MPAFLNRLMDRARAQAGPLAEEKPPISGSGFVDPRGGINPAPPPMIPPRAGGFLGPMINNAGPMASSPKPPMPPRPMAPRPMGMASRGMASRGVPPQKPGVLGTRRRMGMF